jgi:hypothetical protein
LDAKYKLCCGWKAIGLRFVSGSICKIEPDTQVILLWGYYMLWDVEKICVIDPSGRDLNPSLKVHFC